MAMTMTFLGTRYIGSCGSAFSNKPKDLEGKNGGFPPKKKKFDFKTAASTPT